MNSRKFKACALALVTVLTVMSGITPMMASTVTPGQRAPQESRNERQAQQTKAKIRCNLSAQTCETQSQPTDFQRKGVSLGAPSQQGSLYAWSQYPSTHDTPYGLYKLNGKEGINLMWQDAFYYDIDGSTLRNGYIKDGKLVGMAVYEIMGMLVDVSRVVYNFETGEVESYDNQNGNIFMDRMTYDPVNNVVYATSNETGDEIKWLKVSEDDWFDWEEVAI